MTQLAEPERLADPEQLPPPMAVLEMLHGLAVARSIQIAADLGLADLLVEAPRTVDDLAATTGTHAPSLYRLMRALATVGIFRELEPECFGQTARSACLASDHPSSMRNAARMSGSDWNWRAWSAFATSINTGESSFQRVHGTDLWTYLHEVDRPAGELFDAAMNDTSNQVNQSIVAGYDFGGIGTLVDVGGGQGGLLAAVLTANPAMRGILFDQPAVVAGAAGAPWGPAMADRWTVIGGSFLAEVPAGGDAYLLKDVIHNWDDAQAEVILGNVRAAMGPGSRLLVVERVFTPGPVPRHVAFLDLQMLHVHGSRERTADEFRGLLARAGFTLDRVLSTTSLTKIIEAH